MKEEAKPFELTFNLRIWKFHFQIFKGSYIKPIFAWHDFWIGVFYDTKKHTTYIFPVPMIGVKIYGYRIKYNTRYNFKRDPFVWLFNFNGKYYQMRDYHNENNNQ